MKINFTLLCILMGVNSLFAQQFKQDTAFIGLGNVRDINGADMDNDGDVDLIVATGSKIGWYQNDGAGHFSNTPTVQVSVFANVTKAVDMDGDNDLDILAAGASSGGSSVFWLPNTNGSGTLGTAVTITTSASNPRDVDAGDLDGDGDLDVAFASYDDGKFKWCKNNSGTWGTATSLTTQTATWARVVKIADLDNDNDLDVVTLIHTVAQISQIAWFKNNGTGTFTAATIAGFDGNNPYDFAIGDLNADGLPDVAATFYNSDVLYWYRNKGDGTFTSRIQIVNNYDGASATLIRDFDQNGTPDIMCAAAGSNIIGLLKNEGAGTFKPYVNINTSHVFGDLGFTSNNHLMFAADLNNDGRMDALATRPNSALVNKFIQQTPQPLSVSSSGNFSLPCSNSQNGSAFLTVQGGTPPYTFAWSAPGLSGDSVYQLSAGTYYCTVTDAGSASWIDTFLISAPAALDITPASTLAYPGNGTATMAVSGGTAPYQWLWSNGDTLETIIAPSGFYYCTVTDANGCSEIRAVSVETLLPLSVLTDLNLTNSPSCFEGQDGSIAVTVTGGAPPYQYLWSNGDTTAQTLNLNSGIYYCTVTDSLGVQSEFLVALSAPPPIIAIFQIINATSGMNDGSIQHQATSGGNGGYQYLWNNNATTASIDQLAAGDYTCTVTDANGCTFVQTFTVMSVVAANEPATDIEVSVSPNPASDKVNILHNLGGNGICIRLFDVSGKLILQEKRMNNGLIELSVVSLSPGYYTLDISDWSGKLTSRKSLLIYR